MNSAASDLKARIRPFWQWWTSQLQGLLPASWRQASGRHHKPLIISAQPDGLHWLTDKGATPLLADQLSQAQQQQLATLAQKAGKVLLLLPKEQVLAKVVQLPGAARNRLEEVLRFEMNRYTPFSAEQVHFAFKELGLDRSSDRLSLMLMVVSKDSLAPLLQQLDLLGLKVSALGTDAPDMPTISLAGKQSQGPGRFAWLLALAALLVLAIGPLVWRESRIQELQEQLAAPKAAAERAMAVKAQISLLTDGAQALVQRKRQQVSALDLLKELTQRIPQHTWISRLEVKDQELRLLGESADASTLVGLMEQSPLLQDARFISPVTVNPRSQRERFALTAKLREGQP
ncbi:PilN domain-containing protein [Gallaecimonas xiamenensis]|uniref:General secretion pathway protein L n=1 Tax=Gallaecimonas xiamenensis 3-C-1 TaxID=745411 RepID=K2IZI9_9GAMM|nr:PilN domain-containing protein [Gallaecimonas xiamenensis]EKE75971.1 general secretion pathway protein L [Gallaecimonas xiamenensis 3-C-1]